MHGLINRALEGFVRDTYGPETWQGIAQAAELGFDGFEAMLSYDDALTHAVIDAASLRLRKTPAVLLEDLGTYLVSHPNCGRLRRLLRFGGDGFVDFMHSLDDLPDRARLAVPDLEFPSLRLVETGEDHFDLICGAEPHGFVHVVMGALRAMADDYGALAILECEDPPDMDAVAGDVDHVIGISVLSTSFAVGRSFELSAQTG